MLYTLAVEKMAGRLDVDTAAPGHYRGTWGVCVLHCLVTPNVAPHDMPKGPPPAEQLVRVYVPSATCQCIMTSTMVSMN